MGLKKVLGNLGRRFKKNDTADVEDTPANDVEDTSKEKPAKKKGFSLPKVSNPFPGLAKGAADVAGKTLKGVEELGRITADNMSREAGSLSEKSGLKDAANKASQKVSEAGKKASEVSKKAGQAVKKPIEKAAQEIRDHAEATKDHPTSGSKAVDLLFPTGGQRPDAEKPAPKPTPKP